MDDEVLRFAEFSPSALVLSLVFYEDLVLYVLHFDVVHFWVERQDLGRRFGASQDLLSFALA